MQSPPSPHFCCQDNKSCSALSARELGIPELFPDEQPPEQRCRRRRNGGGGLHPAATPRPALCPQPLALRGVTLPPASRHTRAAADSTANPRLPRIPATTHAARWWPLESSGWPHRQTRLDEERGSHKRRSRRVRNTCASNVVGLTWATRERNTNDPLWNATWPGNCLVISPTPCLR